MLAKVVIENGQKKIQALTADTGIGAPVGSIIVVCSNILPSGYLGLGVQYDITNYPALYQVLGTDTTPTASALGLPTLSSGQYAIKATSGLTENQQENVLNTINENNSYSTEEHPTGKKWIDGKPIYSKSGYVSSISSVPYTVDSVLTSTYVNVLIESKASMQYYNNKVVVYGYLSGTDRFSLVVIPSGLTLVTNFSLGDIHGGVYWSVEYTKTTD